MWIRALQVALGFLTTLPLPIIKDWRSDDLRLAVRVYPVVGLVIGLALALVMRLTVALEPLLSATLVVMLWLVITGGLHFDGFCDMADASLAPKTVEERWRIAKDPRIGSFALMAGSLLIIAKVSAIAALLESAPQIKVFVLLLLAPVLARTLVTWVMAGYPVHDSSLLGRQSHLRWDEIFWPLGLGLGFTLIVASFVITFMQLVLLLLVVFASTVLIATFLNQKMQGLGGDAYGAVVETSEVMWLIAANFLM